MIYNLEGERWRTRGGSGETVRAGLSRRLAGVRLALLAAVTLALVCLPSCRRDQPQEQISIPADWWRLEVQTVGAWPYLALDYPTMYPTEYLEIPDETDNRCADGACPLPAAGLHN